MKAPLPGVQETANTCCFTAGCSRGASFAAFTREIGAARGTGTDLGTYTFSSYV